MIDTTPPNEPNKIAADTIEQLELANQALETAKTHMEEAQNVLADTKEALAQHAGVELFPAGDTQTALEAAKEALEKRLSGETSHDGGVLQ
jgi:hypothetical protein